MGHHTLNAQNMEQTYRLENYRINQTGMYTLGAWAVSNMVTGSIGWANGEGSNRYFHQMNVMWNTVNLAIAGFSLYNTKKNHLQEMKTDEFLLQNQTTEKILLINSILDLGYMGAGILLRKQSDTSENKAHQLKGYGNSLILQGGFLLIFDVVMYSKLKSKRLDFLEKLNLSGSAGSIGIRYKTTF